MIKLKWYSAWILVTWTLLVGVPAALATDRHVPGEYSTIRAAIDASVDGDTIVVADGVYRGTGNKSIMFGGRAITVRSEHGPTGCTIDCEGDGNAFLINTGDVATVQGFTITNGWHDYGGGLSAYRSATTIADCIFLANSASQRGGALYLNKSSDTLVNCLIIGNHAADRAGGIGLQSASPTIRNCTLYGNTAVNAGGGVSFNGNCDSPVLFNCILWGDSASLGPELALYTTEYGSPYPSVAYTDLAGGSAAVYISGSGQVNWGDGVIDVDPLFVDAAGGDLHLSAGSPCIDAGDPDYASAPHDLDLDGNKRVWDGNADGTARIDMGSYEYGSFRYGDMNCDGFINGFDIDPFVLALTYESLYHQKFPNCDRALADCNGDGYVDAFDIDAFVKCIVDGGCP